MRINEILSPRYDDDGDVTVPEFFFDIIILKCFSRERRPSTVLWCKTVVAVAVVVVVVAKYVCKVVAG